MSLHNKPHVWREKHCNASYCQTVLFTAYVCWAYAAEYKSTISRCLWPSPLCMPSMVYYQPHRHLGCLHLLSHMEWCSNTNSPATEVAQNDSITAVSVITVLCLIPVAWLHDNVWHNWGDDSNYNREGNSAPAYLLLESANRWQMTIKGRLMCVHV